MGCKATTAWTSKCATIQTSKPEAVKRDAVCHEWPGMVNAEPGWEIALAQLLLQLGSPLVSASSVQI